MFAAFRMFPLSVIVIVFKLLIYHIFIMNIIITINHEMHNSWQAIAGEQGP